MKRHMGQGLGGSAWELLSPLSWVVSSLGTCMCSTTWRLSKPLPFGIFMSASSCRHDQFLTPFSVFLPSEENGEEEQGQDWKVQACDYSLDCSMTRSYTGAIQEPTGVNSLERKTLLLPRELQSFQEPCVTRSKTKY